MERWSVVGLVLGRLHCMQGKRAKIDATRALSCNGEVPVLAYNEIHFYAHFPENTRGGSALRTKPSWYNDRLIYSLGT